MTEHAKRKDLVVGLCLLHKLRVRTYPMVSSCRFESCPQQTVVVLQQGPELCIRMCSLLTQYSSESVWLRWRYSPS